MYPAVRYIQIADVMMLVYDAENEESLDRVEMVRNEISTEQLGGRKPAIFIVENKTKLGNYSSLKVSSLESVLFSGFNNLDRFTFEFKVVCRGCLHGMNDSVKRVQCNLYIHDVYTVLKLHFKLRCALHSRALIRT